MNYSLALAKDLLRHITVDKDILYIFCPFSIGDILNCGGLCHAILKKKRKKACVMILPDRFKNSGAINFVGVKEIRYMPQMLMDFIKRYIYVTRDYETDNFIYGHFPVKQNTNLLIWNQNLSFVNRWKENAFGLPLNAEFLPPMIDPPTDYQKQRLHDNYILDKERTIILAPYANSIANLEQSFWEKFVYELAKRNKDYVIYTNVAASHEKVIPSTAPIITTFQELTYLAEKVKCFIGLRSGIFDLLAFTNARLLYILNNILDWYFDLNVNFNHTNSKAFYLTSALEQAQLQAFMKQNNLTSIDNITFYGRISGRDVSLNKDSLIEKIVSAVD